MAAPKGNKYAVGNNGGRPPIYDDPNVLQKECDSYFEYCKQQKEPATITGLTLYLGFAERNSLDYYETKEEFSHIIKRARKKVEHEYEKRLSSQNVTGSIFALKNMGWKEKTDHDINLKGGIQVIMENAENCKPIPGKENPSLRC